MWNQVGSESVLLIRTYAFFSRNVDVLWFLVSALSGVVVYQLYVDTTQMLLLPFFKPDKGPCFPMSKPHSAHLLGFFIVPLLFDTIITFMTRSISAAVTVVQTAIWFRLSFGRVFSTIFWFPLWTWSTAFFYLHFRKQLANGTAKVRSRDLPIFLWENNDYGPEDITSGLFRNAALVMVFKHIFTSPSSALQDLPQQTKAKGSQARRNKMTSVTAVGSIAYTCIKLIILAHATAAIHHVSIIHVNRSLSVLAFASCFFRFWYVLHRCFHFIPCLCHG